MISKVVPGRAAQRRGTSAGALDAPADPVGVRRGRREASRSTISTARAAPPTPSSRSAAARAVAQPAGSRRPGRVRASVACCSSCVDQDRSRRPGAGVRRRTGPAEDRDQPAARAGASGVTPKISIGRGRACSQSSSLGSRSSRSAWSSVICPVRAAGSTWPPCREKARSVCSAKVATTSWATSGSRPRGFGSSIQRSRSRDPDVALDAFGWRPAAGSAAPVAGRGRTRPRAWRPAQRVGDAAHRLPVRRVDLDAPSGRLDGLAGRSRAPSLTSAALDQVALAVGVEVGVGRVLLAEHLVGDAAQRVAKVAPMGSLGSSVPGQRLQVVVEAELRRRAGCLPASPYAWRSTSCILVEQRAALVGEGSVGPAPVVGVEVLGVRCRTAALRGACR